MKKILILVLTLMLTLTLFSACNSEENDTDNTLNVKTESNEINFKQFKYKNTEIKLNTDSKPVVDALGEPNKKDSFDAGCGDSALGYIFSYSGFDIYTDPEGGVDLVNKIVITSDMVSTPEGGTVGMSKSEIVKLFGTPSEESDEVLRYNGDKCMLQFELNNDKNVVKIVYRVVK